jgi:hypothetical protein
MHLAFSLSLSLDGNSTKKIVIIFVFINWFILFVFINRLVCLQLVYICSQNWWCMNIIFLDILIKNILIYYYDMIIKLKKKS